MQFKKSTIYKLLLLLLIPIANVFVRLYASYPTPWEQYYSMGINKVVIQIISLICGIFPFSVFEVLIVLAAIFLVVSFFYTIYLSIKSGRKFYIVLGRYGLNLAVTVAIVYSTFQFLWGLNYKRPQFGYNHGLVVQEYTPEELSELYAYLLTQAAKEREIVPEDENGIMRMYTGYRDAFSRAQLGYDAITDVFIELDGTYGKPKPFLASALLNYTKVTGMYSPFTGEPNVNVAIPDMYIPSTTCHEMAHQRGYGFEDQCNFIAYITAISHPDADFRYSGYLLGIAYVSNALAAADFDLLIARNQEMSDKIMDDLNYGNEFWAQYEGKVEEVADSVNNSFLVANGVESGTQSYGKVVDLLLAYYDKYF
ncbi:MAG: hypothetical protein ATN35_11100 [Epulopiscium sp. Nele67-Bin004]|nr:MAG: hypothetical protein ATN35_11100 [Epulopiscium sp. Nele67-Bin004]